MIILKPVKAAEIIYAIKKVKIQNILRQMGGHKHYTISYRPFL